MNRLNRKGFTLLEILIVIVILGIVAGLAIPVFTANMTKAKGQEALNVMASIKSGLTNYFATNNTYVGASLVSTTAGYIGISPNNDVLAAGGLLVDPATGQSRSFFYTIAPLAGTFTVTAACEVAAFPAGMCGAADTLTLTQAGNATRNGRFA